MLDINNDLQSFILWERATVVISYDISVLDGLVDFFV